MEVSIKQVYAKMAGLPCENVVHFVLSWLSVHLCGCVALASNLVSISSKCWLGIMSLIRYARTRHLLLYSLDMMRSQLRVDVPKESSLLEKPHLSSHVPITDGEALPGPTVVVPSVEVRPYLPGTSFSPSPPHPVLVYPILLTARQRKEYFAPPGSFDILPMLKNPMVMMMVFVCITLFLLPKAMVGIEHVYDEGADKGNDFLVHSSAKHGSRIDKGDVSTARPHYEYAEQSSKRRFQWVSNTICQISL